MPTDCYVCGVPCERPAYHWYEWVNGQEPMYDRGPVCCLCHDRIKSAVDEAAMVRAIAKERGSG